MERAENPCKATRLIKIVSDGMAQTTNIVDAETGERIGNVVAIEWKASLEAGGTGLAVATITVIDVPVELSMDTEQVVQRMASNE